MPSQRTADAARISPYLTHAVSNHGQVTLQVPADNNGRVRQANTKGNRSRPRQERNARPEEGVRFNVGPRSLRNMVGNRALRHGGRQDRGREENNESYPDYPPPSFLEATSVPVSPRNATSMALSQPASSVVPTEPTPTLPEIPLTQAPISPSSSALLSGNDVDSDTSSLEIIDMDSLPLVEGPLLSGTKLEENIRRDWLNRRGIEFPPPPEGQARGRSKNRSRAILDSDSEDGAEETPYALRQTSPKNKNPSPLRTLFPYRAMIVDEPLSASPNASPYSSRSSLPFLSATSLRTSLSTTSISSVKGEGFFSRRFLSFKGKERAKESLDSWEVVGKQLDPSIASDNPSSPIRSQSFTYGMPVPAQVVKEQAPPAPPRPTVATSATTPHPLSLRDRKSPPVPFVTRPKKKAPPPPSKPAPVASVPQGPILTFVRTRLPPPTPQKPAHLSSSPLVHDSWHSSNLEVGAESISTLQRAIATPLPVSPIEGDSWNVSLPSATPVLPSLVENSPASICAPTSSSPAVLLGGQIPALENDTLVRDMSSDLRLFPRPAKLSSADSISVPVRTPMHVGRDNRIPTWESGTIGQDPPVCHLSNDYSEDDECQSPTSVRPSSGSEHLPASRRHYPGRPLPQPPGATRSLVDFVYGPATDDESHARQNSRCPEGLLIDFDGDSPIAGASISSPPTPLTNGDENNLAVSSYAPSSSSVDLLGSIADMETSAFTPHPRSQVDPNPGLLAQASSRPTPFSEFTDLDVLVSQISEEEHQDGLDYDALLLLSEFIGSASPRQGSTHSAAASSTSLRLARSNALLDPAFPERTPASNMPLSGNVRLERRRTTKDGRVKLKLGLLDTAVDKCGICLTQFRNGDAAQLGSACRHAFHEKCLGRWLVRSETCPMCRVSLAQK